MNPTNLPPLERANRSSEPRTFITIVIPVHNEELNIPVIFREIQNILRGARGDWRVLFVDDGSTDTSVHAINTLREHNPEVQSIELSRNFGKEVAMTAGLQLAEGNAVICMDADLQHPPLLLPEFIRKWEDGAEVVIGVRKSSSSDSVIKRVGSNLFYKIMRMTSETEVIPGATDFRMLDRKVIDAYKALKEHNRMNRGLIDWLGFHSELIYFDAPERRNGKGRYGTWNLIKLAIASFISMSLRPLWIAGLAGVLMFFLSGALLIVMMLDKFYLYKFNFSGPAILVTVNVLLVSIMLMCVGIVGFYVAHIHHETQGRPLYVVRRKKL